MKSQALTIFGSCGAAAGAVVAISLAWDVMGLPQFARAEELNQLREFSVETRIMLLDDQLYDAQRQFSAAQRELETYTVEGKPAPRWLRDDILDLQRTISRRQADIKGLQ
jgi:hypothetical protein